VKGVWEMKKRAMRPNILILIPACFVIATLFAPFGRSEQYASYTKVGDAVPSFSVTTLEGREISISALKGKVVLLNFWATWCPPCHTEMPRLEKDIWEKCKSNDFEMIAIAREQTSKEITEYREKYKYSFPMGPDPKRAIYSKFANAGIPRNYVINPEGIIVYQSYGYSSDDFDKMVKILEKELNKLKNRGAGQ
jgi:peroxiredoxin